MYMYPVYNVCTSVHVVHSLIGVKVNVVDWVIGEMSEGALLISRSQKTKQNLITSEITLNQL